MIFDVNFADSSEHPCLCCRPFTCYRMASRGPNPCLPWNPNEPQPAGSMVHI